MWLYEALEQNVGLDGWMDGWSGYPLDCYDYDTACLQC